MVSKKKSAKKDEKLAEEVTPKEATAETEKVEVQVDEESPIDAEEPETEEIVLLDTAVKAEPAISGDVKSPNFKSITVTATDKPEEPKVAFIDETTKLTNLLTEAPKVPLLLNMEQTVAFVDKYRVWKNRVKATIG